MTEALRYIKAELGRGNSQFFVPARILREEDRPLLHRYALVFRGEYLPKIACPECGELVEVRRGVGETGEPHYSALCLHCEVLEERSIAPEEVELLAFQIRAFRQYVSNPKETGEYVAEAEACLPVQAVGESAASPGSQAQSSEVMDRLERIEKKVDSGNAVGEAALHCVSCGEQGKPLSDKRQAGGVRREMVQKGYELVLSENIQDTEAARQVIQAYKGRRGAYSMNELPTLRKAIGRERENHGIERTTRKRGGLRT